MELSEKKGIQRIISALAQSGLREVVICPGSRNAPLIISFNRHPQFRCTAIRDERSAAFYALGKAIELQQPVAVVCTSGSAAVNFAPAVSEAYYQRIPLLLITADRPAEWIGQGDGQTINQHALFANYIRKDYNLKGDATAASEFWYNDRCIAEGLAIATKTDPGPVHFNIPLSEPLYGTAECDTERLRIFEALDVQHVLDETTMQTLRQQFEKAAGVMVIAGQRKVDPEFQRTLAALAEHENTIVLTESTSNVHSDYFIEHIDRCISTLPQDDMQQYAPELLITVGGAVVSKRIKALLRQYRPLLHWNIDPFDAFVDTYQSLTTAIPMESTAFLTHFLQNLVPVKSGYRSLWVSRSNILRSQHERFCEEAAYSDFTVFKAIYDALPPGISLHLANSSPVRYAQLFDNRNVAESWSNRGTSGIDGCTSTAMGAASASPDKKFLLITGDVAFHYDINGLWNDENIRNLGIIVINNGGGGIFRIISGPEKVDELQAFFETSMHSDAGSIAAHYRWNYLRATDQVSLAEALSQFFHGNFGRTILEVFTDSEKNPVVLDDYWKFLKEKSG